MSRPLAARERFEDRHNGPSEADIAAMLEAVGADSLETLIDQTVPAGIRQARPLELGPALDEESMVAAMRELASENQVHRSLIGMGYSDTITPPVIGRNILENPGWYTQYTPYQSEIAQGRLEALLNFQTLTIDLTGLSCANSSLLDEATACAEAMTMALSRIKKGDPGVFVVDAGVHPQSIEVVQTRAEPLGLQVVVTDAASHDFEAQPAFGVLVQYPSTDGTVSDWGPTFERAAAAKATCVVATDLLALTLLRKPASFGAEIVVGNSQRFGVPLGYGGPHAAFMTAKDDFKRRMPGRIVGVSVDADGGIGLRLALQTREQHIRRDRATSNICTAQVLLAVMASMYAVYHGPDGLTRIAGRCRLLAEALRDSLRAAGMTAGPDVMFDTLWVEVGDTRDDRLAAARAAGYNLRPLSDTRVGIALDERSTVAEVAAVAGLFGATVDEAALSSATELPDYPAPHGRASEFLTHPVFHSHRSETELLRYIFKLQGRDLSLTHSMIALGSCTMKLNATSEMIPVTFAEMGGPHPFSPPSQSAGYARLFRELEDQLAQITGMAGVSLQPNAGSQGEYAGLLVIRKYLQAKGEGHRNVCLIPSSAHGTNPASAVMVGMKVVVTACDDDGNIDVADLTAKADQHADNLAALMVTYPSTHGVFEEAIKDVCRIIHERGGQVYMDGANLNAQVGLCRPGDIGADVCHLNLHKTFCIPHGGGGPGMGPIAVAAHLAPHLMGRPVLDAWDGTIDPARVGPVSAAPWGSASILPISYSYIRMMGGTGLTQATRVAILNANYVAQQLEPHYPILYKGAKGRVAHECILDFREIKKTSGVTVEDVAKRLMDYGFHAPTISFPVAGTIMVEPTESESKAELDRFCEAMIGIRNEIAEIERGEADADNNLLKNAPHTARAVTGDDWDRPYTRARAAYPTAWTREVKFWPPVARIDNVHGDRNLVCACPPIEAYASTE